MENIISTQNIDLSYIQTEAIKAGKAKREWMNLLISNIINAHSQEKYSNLYIYSPPGLGKTFTVTEQLKSSDIQSFLVTGNTSLFAFGIQLAVINYLNPEMEPIIIHVDDCDEIFKNEPNCNTMKKILDTDKKFVYEKSLTSQWSNLSDVQRAAIENFREEGKMGFVVPTNNMRFIFTSNFQLPFDDEVAEARKKSKSKAILLAHRNAIRSRCKVGDFELTQGEHWGWMADIVLNNDIINGEFIDEVIKVIILDFMWHHWSNLKERSVRVIEKMITTMNMFPETYETVWRIDFLKH
ncbi:MAG: hypothetical protein J0I09_14405 [Sphingobacteriia bacterium]|nr:hypothetical protein [Sphingobacteriia bacterium]